MLLITIHTLVYIYKHTVMLLLGAHVYLKDSISICLISVGASLAMVIGQSDHTLSPQEQEGR